MNKSINYSSRDGRPHTIMFHDLLEQGHNMDAAVRDGSLFSRPDHNYAPLLEYLHPGDVVYDCGAYIGTFSIPMCLEGMMVYSFEAWPDNAARCEKNYAPYDNIESFSVALSNENKTETQQIVHCMDWVNHDSSDFREIRNVRLDDFIIEQNLPDPHLIKMDIEGMESLAMLGCTRLLEEVRPVWQMGYHFRIEHGVDMPSFPGWVDTHNGGFDWRTIEELDYVVCDHHGTEIGSQVLFSRGGEYIFVPRELWGK